MKFEKLTNLLNLNEKTLYIGTTTDPKKLDMSFGSIDSQNYKILNRIKGSIILESLEEQLKTLLEFKKYIPSDFYIKYLINIFSNYFIETKHIKCLEDIINKKINFKIEIGKKIAIESITGYYNHLYSIPNSFFKDLTFLDAKDKSGAAIGKGELVLGLFTEFTNAISGGDLELNGRSVEVKGPRGRFKGQYKTKTKDDVTKYLLNYLQQLNYPNLNKLFNTLNATKSIGTKIFPDLYELINFYKNEKEIIKNILNIFQSTNINLSFKTNEINEVIKISEKKDNNKFMAFLLAIHLYEYKIKENIEFLLLFNKSYSEFILHNISKLNSVLDLYSILEQEKIELASWASTPREAAFGITIK